MSYRGKRVIVTGGLGFIGSNLVIRLVNEGAEVTVIDSRLPGCGANPHNLAPVKNAVRVVESDVADTDVFGEELAGAQVIFNLAGEISHIHSMEFPERDLQVNTVSQLRFLLACKAAAPGVRIVYAGTRQVYGVPKYLPVDEGHPVQPIDFNGVHKFAATAYHLMLSRVGLLDAIILRLTNVYGPRMALDVSCQGVLGAFVRRLSLGQSLEIFGDGSQTRDPIYVDDAVHAFMLAGAVRPTPGRTYNVGCERAMTMRDIAQIASRAAGVDEPVFKPFPPELKRIDIGSYRTDTRRIERDLHWHTSVDFATGIRRTLEFYRAELPNYLDPEKPEPACQMPEHDGITRRLAYVQVG